VKYGLSSGVGEMLTERLFGGLDFFGKGFVSPALRKLMPNAKIITDTTKKVLEDSGFMNSMAARILRRVGSAGGEATEEMIMEIVTPYLERASYNPDAVNATLAEIGYSGGIGAIVGTILGIPVMVSEGIQSASEKKSLDALLDESRNEVLAKIDMAVASGKMTEEEAAATRAEAEDILAGKGSLNVTDSQEEVKISGEALDTVYDSYEDAKQAMMQEARTKKDGEKITANYIENGEVKTFTTTAKGGTLGLGRSGIAAPKYQKIAKAKNVTERSGYQLGVREDIIKEVSALSTAIGKEVVFDYDARAAVHGGVSEREGKIYVNVNSAQSPARAVIAHEMTHILERTASYGKLYELMKKHYGSSWESKLAEIKANYAAQGKPLNRKINGYAEAETELMAMFVEEKLLTDEAVVREIVQTDKSVAQKIIDWLNKVIQKMVGNKEQKVLAEARDLWNKALQEEQSGKVKPRTVEVEEEITEKVKKRAPEVEARDMRMSVGKSEDAEYIDAVNRIKKMDQMYINAILEEDYITAQELVDAAAKDSGFTVKAMHGTPERRKLQNDSYVHYDPNAPGDGWMSNEDWTVFDSTKSIAEKTDGSAFFFTNNKRVADFYSPQSREGDPKIFDVYLHMGNTLVVDCKGSPWYQVPIPKELPRYKNRHLLTGEELSYDEADTKFICRQAKNLGYDSVHFKNIVDGNAKDTEMIGDVYAVFNPNQIKSADPVTYDEEGNIIPLSERFNEANDDIRYSVGSDTEYMEAVENDDMGTAERIIRDAAVAAGYDSPKLYHGTKSFGFTELRTEDLDIFAWSPFFTTSDPKLAETYSGKTERRQIKGGYPKATREQIDEYLAEHRGVLKKRIRAIDNHLSKTTLPRTNDAKRKALMRDARDELMKMVEAQDSATLSAAYNSYMDAVDALEKTALLPAEEKLFEFDELHNARWEIGRIIGAEEVFVDSEGKLVTYENREEIESDTAGIYSFYANLDGMLDIDGEGKYWNHIDGSKIGKDGDVKTREVAEYAKENGYKGVIIRNITDSGGQTDYYEPGDIYIFFEPAAQVKSADTVTYDDNGEIIPPSERFNEENKDIRWSVGKGKENRKMRDADLKTIKKMEKIVKKAENQRDFANQEKEELKAKQKEKEKKYKAELYRRRKETDAERKAQKKSLAAIAKEYEKGHTKKARNLVAEEQKRIDAMYPKTDKELRKERADAIVKEYFKQREKPDPNSTESTWLKNKSVRNIVDQFRRETIEQLVYVGRFTVTNDNVILDENQQEVAVRKDDTWDFSEVKNTYTPYFGMTLLAKQEGIDVDRFFTMFAKIRDIQRKPKDDFKTRSRKEEVVAYINSLNLTKKQKEFLYYDAARYAKSKMPTFLDGGNVTEEKGNIRGRMMEALDNISFDMFNGHMKEDSRWAKEDSAQIRQEDINNFVEMLFGKEDSEAKDLFLDRFTRMIVDYSEQMEEARLLRASNLLVNKPKQSDPLKMRVVRAYREAKQNFLCEGEAFERMADKMKNPLIRARYYQAKSAVAIANEMINGKHQRNLDGDLMGKSLYQIFEPIFKADTKAKNSNGIELLTQLVNNRHDIYRQKNGKGYTGNTIEECETIVENISMAHPEILKVADELVEYGRNLLRMCVDCGRLSKEDFDYFVAKYPYYVPAYRIEENEIMDRSGKVRRDTAVIKTARFGNRDVLPLWDQMVRRTNETIKSCKKNQLAYELVKATRKKGHEDFISSVTKSVDQGNNETAAAELGQVEDIGKARRTQEDDTFIPWYCNGEKFDVDIADASLLYGWDRINYRMDEKQYHRVLRKMNSFRRAVLTQYNPTFWLTNHIRDVSDMFLYNQHAQNLTGYMVEAYGEMFGGKIGGTKAFQKAYKKATGKEYVYNEEKRADALERYLSKGASQASIFEYDNTNAGRKTTKGKVQSAMKKPLEAFDVWNFMFEQIPRLAVFNETIDRLTKERDKGKNEYTDEEIESIAAYQAADATLNFGRSGTVVKNLNTYGCTFLNAGVQGMDRARRMFTQIKDGDKKTVMLNLCGLVFKIFAMGYSVHIILDWIYGGDDEYANAIREFLYGDDEEEIMQEWKEMSDYNKMNYLVININGAWFRIPQGRLSAFLYSFGYNGEKVFDGEMDALDLVEAQWDMAKETVLFGNPLTNNILGPVIEAWRNKDNWGNDIVSEYEDMGEGFHYLEYDDETSMAARKAAEFGHWLTADLFGVEDSRILDFSPKKLDHVMKQYFGSYANLLMPFLDGGTNLKDKVTEGLAETLFKKFYINPVESNRLAGDYYDLKEEFENTAKAHDNDSPYAVAVKVFDDYNELLKPLREQITAISDDPNLTAEEKAEQILALREEMNQIYRDAVADAWDALGFATENYTGKDDNNQIYDDWVKMFKDAEWRSASLNKTEKKKYDDLIAAGLDDETALKVMDRISALEPVEGKSSVSEFQKVKAIADMGLSKEQEIAAMSAALNESAYAKFTSTTDYGVTAQVWADFQMALEAADYANNGNGSYDNEEKATALDSMNISNETKAALWQIKDNQLGKSDKSTSWKAGRNPYSYAVGAAVVENYMNKKVAMDEAEAADDYSSASLTPVNLSSIVSPVSGVGEVTSGYGYRNTGIPGASTYHQAIDIAAEEGTPIGAALSGVVTKVSQSNSGYGNSIEITSKDENGNTIITKYSHLSEIGVEENQVIDQGKQIGKMGNTGTGSGSHLDFKISINGEWKDPAQYIDFTSAGVVDTKGYTDKTASVAYSGGTASGGGSSGGSSSGRSGSSSGRSGGSNSSSRVASVSSNRSGGSGLTLPSVGTSSKPTGRSTNTPTYGAMGLTLPRVPQRDTSIAYNKRGTSTPRTSRTDGKGFWDPDILA